MGLDGEDAGMGMGAPKMPKIPGAAPRIRPELAGGPVQPMGGSPNIRRFRMGHPGATDGEDSYDGEDGSGIHIKKSHEGLLHEDTGTPEGEPIPEKKLEAAKNSSDPAERKRATFAENAKHWKHDGEDSGGKMEKTMHEYKHGELHSGSKEGPKVEDRKQAIAIGLSQARKAGEEV